MTCQCSNKQSRALVNELSSKHSLCVKSRRSAGPINARAGLDEFNGVVLADGETIPIGGHAVGVLRYGEGLAVLIDAARTCNDVTARAEFGCCLGSQEKTESDWAQATRRAFSFASR